MKLKIFQAFNKWKKRQFDYGDADCCQFVGFVVCDLTGKDFLADFHYKSEHSANEIIAEFGSLETTAATVLGDPQKDVYNLEDGSPVLVEMPYGQLLGVKVGAVAVCLGKTGFVNIPSKMIRSGWDLCKL